MSKLNPFSTIWCVIENIFLAAAAEGLGCSMRIPLNEEHDIVKAKLKVPPTYMIPVFIGVAMPIRMKRCWNRMLQTSTSRSILADGNEMPAMVKETLVKNVITKSNLPVCDYSVNPYVGCILLCVFYEAFHRAYRAV